MVIIIFSFWTQGIFSEFFLILSILFFYLIRISSKSVLHYPHTLKEYDIIVVKKKLWDHSGKDF